MQAATETIPFQQRLSCTVNEACNASGLGRTKLYSLIKDGQIKTVHVGKRQLVLVRSLRAFIDPTSVQNEQAA